MNNTLIKGTLYGNHQHYHKNRLCPRHLDTQLRKKKRFGVWKIGRKSCPRCDHECRNTQGPTAPTTPMPQQPPSPATKSQPSTQVPTTSISSPIADIQEEGLMGLSNLALHDNNNVTKNAKTGGPTVPAGVPTFPSSLSRISATVSATVSKMQMNEQDADIQVDGLKELGNLAVDDENNQETIAQLGGIARIVSAMNDHPKNAYVQEYGCAALQKLAENDINPERLCLQ